MTTNITNDQIVVDDLTEFGTIGVVVRLTPELAEALGADPSIDHAVSLDEAWAANEYEAHGIHGR
jgi:hypothetical protein